MHGRRGRSKRRDATPGRRAREPPVQGPRDCSIELGYFFAVTLMLMGSDTEIPPGPPDAVTVAE
jgi:hypothetical protein